MSKAKITVTTIEIDGMDADTEFSLIRMLREQLERAGGTTFVTAVAEAAPAAAPEPAAEDDEPVAPVAPSRAEDLPPAFRRPHVLTQEEIETIVIDTLQLDPAIDLQVLANKAYGPTDKRAKTKLTWTLKGLAGRGLVERLSASSWRVLGVDERGLEDNEDGEREEDDAEGADELEELDVG